MRGIFFWLLTVFQAIIPVFIRKVVAQKKICDTKNPVRLQHPWKSENHAVRNRFHLRNGLRKRNLRNRKKQALNTLDEDHLEGNWLRGYFQDRKLTRSKGLSAQIFFNRLVWSPPKTGSALRNIYFVNHKIKNELSTADSWILPQVFDACKRVCLINGQGEQESCHFCGLDENAGKFQVGKATQERLIIERFLVGLTAIGVTRLHVFRENALLLYYYFRGFGDWDWR